MCHAAQPAPMLSLPRYRCSIPNVRVPLLGKVRLPCTISAVHPNFVVTKVGGETISIDFGCVLIKTSGHLASKFGLHLLYSHKGNAATEAQSQASSTLNVWSQDPHHRQVGHE